MPPMTCATYHDQNLLVGRVCLCINSIYGILTLSLRKSQSNRKQFIDLLFNSMDWFLYDRDLSHERVKPTSVFESCYLWTLYLVCLVVEKWFMMLFYLFNYLSAVRFFFLSVPACCLLLSKMHICLIVAQIGNWKGWGGSPKISYKVPEGKLLKRTSANPTNLTKIFFSWSGYFSPPPLSPLVARLY